MDHLETGVKFAFAVFPESSAFFQPGTGAFYHPPLGNDRKGVQFVAFGDLYRCAEGSLHGVCERLTGIAAIRQHTAHLAQTGLASRYRQQGTGAIRHLGGRDRDGMG